MRTTLLALLTVALASCGQLPGTPGPQDQATHTLNISSTDRDVSLGDAHAFQADGIRWWSDGIRWWSDGIRWWSDGIRWWSDGIRWWSDGVYQPVPENSIPFNLIHLENAYSLAPKAGTGVIIAVLDTGVDTTHPMLRGSTLPGYDYVDSDDDAREGGETTDHGYGHGTAVAGIIRQIAPGASILPMRVLNTSGSGEGRHLARAIREATDRGAHIINLSVSAQAPSDGVRAALQYATSRNVVIIAAGGNDGNKRPQAPAWQLVNPDPIGQLGLSVGVTDQNGTVPTWSNAGSEILAPGVKIRTAYPGGRVVDATGSSFSTPIVSGTVALALAQGADPHAVMQAVQSSSTNQLLNINAFLTSILH